MSTRESRQTSISKHGTRPIGSGDFCLISEAPIEDLVLHLQKEGVAVEQGPIARTGATGSIWSVYFRDPDGNLVEVSNYR